MAYLLLAVGALLSVAGTYLAISGYHIVQIEEGWTSVIAGATLFVGGFLIMALSLVLRVLLQLKAALVARPLLAPETETAAPTPAEAAPVAAPSAKIEPKIEDRLRPERPDRIATPALPRVAGFGAPDLAAPGLGSAFDHAGPQVWVESPYASPALAAQLDPVDVPPVQDDYELETPSTPEHDLVAAHAVPEPLSTLPAQDFQTQGLQTQGHQTQDPHARDFATQDFVPQNLVPQNLVPQNLVPQEPEPPHVPVHEPVYLSAATNNVLTQAAHTDAPPAQAPPMGDWLDQAFAEFDQDLPKPTAPKIPETNYAPRAIPSESEPVREPAFAMDAKLKEAAVTPKPAPIATTPAAPPPSGPASAVIGRYESDGTSYVMYADGSIDAHSENGVYRFASMSDLKAFIET